MDKYFKKEMTPPDGDGKSDQNQPFYYLLGEKRVNVANVAKNELDSPQHVLFI